MNRFQATMLSICFFTVSHHTSIANEISISEYKSSSVLISPNKSVVGFSNKLETDYSYLKIEEKKSEYVMKLKVVGMWNDVTITSNSFEHLELMKTALQLGIVSKIDVEKEKKGSIRTVDLSVLSLQTNDGVWHPMAYIPTRKSNMDGLKKRITAAKTRTQNTSGNNDKRTLHK